jgi:hypothetical protein
MVFVKATDDSESGVIPPPEAFEAMGRFIAKSLRKPAPSPNGSCPLVVG